MHSTHKLITLTKEILDHQSDKDFFSNPQHYDTLIHLIMRHNHLYYIDHQPVISDNDYDTLFSLLQQFEAHHPELITPDSPTQRLANQYDIQSGFEKANHTQPILSLQNTYNSEDIRDWYTSISQLLSKTNYDHLPLEFILEPKYDGLSIVLTYRKGQLVQAVTRGDGYTGDNVTANIKTIPHLPKQLPYQEEIILRGEVMMPKSVFKKLNQEREANDEPLFANTRNAAAGSLKLLDTNQVAKRGLTLYLYDVLQGPKSVLEHFQQMHFPQTTRTHSLDSLIATIDDHSFKNTLLDSDIDFDGLVIKVADNSAREILGSTNHHPRRAIAYKFPAQQALTCIERIEWQVGRTGILTPVAHITPTSLSGVTISRISLHNPDFITSKDIQQGDQVWIQRSGEVIPYIVSVATQHRTGREKPVNLTHIQCPACQKYAQLTTNQVGTKNDPNITTQLFCTNPDCHGILKEKLKHFISKQAMNIISLGDSTIDLLVDQGILQSLSDIYTLTEPSTLFILKRLPGLGNKKIETFCEEISKSKHNELRRLINGLGINGIGIKLAKEIEKHLSYRPEPLHGITDFFSVITQNDFLNHIYGVGEKIIYELQSRYHEEKNRLLIQAFEGQGVQPILPHNKESHSKQKSICITGTFPISRSELEFHIKQAGYQYHSSLTKNTDYLLVGSSHAGSKKDKAGSHTKILDNLQEIYSLLNISTPLFGESTLEQPSGGTMQSLFQ